MLVRFAPARTVASVALALSRGASVHTVGGAPAPAKWYLER